MIQNLGSLGHIKSFLTKFFDSLAQFHTFAIELKTKDIHLKFYSNNVLIFHNE